MEELNIQDFKRLNENFIYISKRKFDLEIDNNIEDVLISDILISLFFKFNRTKSKVAISIVGSYVGETVIKNWGGNWNTTDLSLNSVGLNKINVNPFSIAHQRLTKGINKMLIYQLDLVSFKANNLNTFSNEENLNKDYIKQKLQKLYNNGWFEVFFDRLNFNSNKESKDYRNYMKFEAAYLLGFSLRYLQSNIMDLRLKEFFEFNPYYGAIVFQNYLIEDEVIVKKLINLLDEGDSNVKLQVLLALVNCKKTENIDKVKKIIYDLILSSNVNDMIFMFYLGQALGNFKDKENINWIKQKLVSNDVSDLVKLSLLIAIQNLKEPEFTEILLNLILKDEINEVLKDEILKTLQYLPITDNEINILLKRYDTYEPYQKIHILNALFALNYNDRVNILRDLLDKEKDSFVRSYILSLLDQLL